MTTFTLADLDALIESRATSTGDKSYTRSLLDAGTPRTAKKFGEEAVEAVIAAMEGNKTDLRNEAADVLYHLLVLLRTGGVSLNEVLKELERRTAQSGHAEKAARPGNG